MNPAELLQSILSEIDGMEELRLHGSNPRKLSDQDAGDLHMMAYGSSTVYDLFEYARRPKIEVIQYMQERHPGYLERMLLNTLRKMAEESST